MIREAFGAEFVGAEGFLDTPTCGLPPRWVTDALRHVVRSWERGELRVQDFDAPLHAARTAYASLIGVDAGRVATGSSVSSLISLVAASIPDGSRVAVLADEFTSVTFPFAAQTARGVTVFELAPGQFEDTAGEFDVTAASLVQSADGAVLDIERLRRSIADTETVSVIDVTQALGWKNVDLRWADAVAGAGYKWLLAPRGVAWISLSQRMCDSLVPLSANPYAGRGGPWSSLYGLPMQLADDARRFDSSPVWFSVAGAGHAMPWLATLDRDAVEAHTVGLANQLRAELGLPLSNSAIVSLPSAPSAAALTRAGIRAAMRADALRVGFHLYNTEADLNRLLDALR